MRLIVCSCVTIIEHINKIKYLAVQRILINAYTYTGTFKHSRHF